MLVKTSRCLMAHPLICSDSENMRPQPFKARFTPRFEAVKEMILSEAEEARVELQIYDGETHLGLNQFLQGAGTSW